MGVMHNPHPYLSGENWPVIMVTAIDGNYGSGTIVQDSDEAAGIYFLLSQIILVRLCIVALCVTEMVYFVYAPQNAFFYELIAGLP